jgi:hypothetical protein
MFEVIIYVVLWYLIISACCGAWFRFTLMEEGQNDRDIYRYGLSWPLRLVAGLTRLAK